jgi:hypothetical protein
VGGSRASARRGRTSVGSVPPVGAGALAAEHAPRRQPRTGLGSWRFSNRRSLGSVCKAMQCRWERQIGRSLSRPVGLRLPAQRSAPLHLDMWHELRFGWAERDIFRMPELAIPLSVKDDRINRLLGQREPPDLCDDMHPPSQVRLAQNPKGHIRLHPNLPSLLLNDRIPADRPRSNVIQGRAGIRPKADLSSTIEFRTLQGHRLIFEPPPVAMRAPVAQPRAAKRL